MRPIWAAIAFVLLGVAVAAWLRSGGDADYPIVNEQSKGTTIIALGDSLTSGHGIGEAESYPAQLGRRLGVEILNKGVAGDTTGKALARLESDVLRHDPRIVLVLLGGNDVMQRQPRAAWFGALEAIIDRIQQQGAMVVLLGMDVGLEGGLHSAYQDVARRKGCAFVPQVMRGIFGSPDLLVDQVHPNQKGAALMADRVATVLGKYVGAGAKPEPVRAER